MQWIPYVMVRITAFFAAGVLLGIFFPSLFQQRNATVFLTILSTVYFVIRFLLVRTVSLRLASGITGLVIIFIAGYLCVLLRDESSRKDSLMQLQEPIQAYRMKLISGVERRANSWRAIGRIQAVRTPTGWVSCDSRLMVYWPLTDRVDSLDYGDILVVKGMPQPVEGPRNPHEFDYRRFLAYRNIFHQQFLRSGDWVIARKVDAPDIAYYAVKARAWTTRVIDQHIDGDREAAIVNAFVIGVTDGIDGELKQAYAAGGAMHALAVSGLHVSILYGVLLFLLRPLEKRRGGPWTLAVVSFAILWMYGFITGLSPSVLRAVTMFSFVAIAKPIGRTTSIINTLAASAFFLLLYDPHLILSAGFQLSYLAVLGIVLLYRPIFNLWEHRWAWSDWVWQITCVSIAAQIATLPVTLYYFNQFPIYFLLANLFVIPGSAIILLAGILLLLISPIPMLGQWLGIVLAKLVWLLNESLFWVEQLPGSLISSLSISLLQAFCIAGMVLITYLIFRSRKFHLILVLFAFAAIFSIDSWFGTSNRPGQFVVYRVAQHTSLEWIDQRRSFALIDSSLHSDPGKVQYHMLPNRLAHRIDRVQTVIPKQGRGMRLCSFRGKRFLSIHAKSFATPTGLECDYLIIGHNAVKSLETLARNVKFDLLILDSSNSLRYCEQLRAEAARLRIPCYSVLTEGAFTLNL